MTTPSTGDATATSTASSGARATAPEPLAEELALEGDSHSEEAYRELVERLNRASVTKRFEAYRDIAWDAPELQIDPADPRWELAATHGLGRTEWYQSLPQVTRAELGLSSAARFTFVGSIFEGVLSRGLLLFASTRPLGSPEYRYAYHEVIEESHHSLMFREFTHRAQVPVKGLSTSLQQGGDRVAGFGREFPELLFMFALGGEDPIDYAQRRSLAQDKRMHPLIERISRIHVTEEARHVSFARAFLRHNVPKLPAERREELAVATPIILSQMAALMMHPSQNLIDHYQMPQQAFDDAYTNNPEHLLRIQESLDKIRQLCVELELMPAKALELWKAHQLWPEAA